MTYSDPFSFLLDAVWDALEANTTFCTLVKEENRIKIESNFKPFKSALVESSVPEVCILPAGKRLFDEASCGGATVTQTLHITVASGVRNISKIFPVEWNIIKAIYVALNDATSNLMDLTWDSEYIIKQITPLPLEEGLTYDDLNRELRGWAAILPLEVKMFFSNSLLGIEESE
jgi:hypothetical protein